MSTGLWQPATKQKSGPRDLTLLLLLCFLQNARLATRRISLLVIRMKRAPEGSVSRSTPLKRAQLYEAELEARSRLSRLVERLHEGVVSVDRRGRVGAVNFLFINASNQLGEFESGMAAALLGAMPAGGGVGTIAIALLWMKLFPALREVDRLA